MRKYILLALLCLVCSLGVVLAQSPDCPAIVDDMLATLDNMCSVFDRNSACYGSMVVESVTTMDPRPEGFFLAPGDRAGLKELREIHPLPLDDTIPSFGVSVLNVQADLPNTLPGQSVLFMLLGDARLTNDVEPDDDTQTPFQSFYFLPGIGRAGCYEAEPMLVIQTPGGIAVNFTFNGVETEMSPDTLLTITPSVCTIHRGNIIQRTDDETAILVANQTVDIRIEDSGKIVVLEARGISAREFARGQQLQEAINALAVANGWSEQYISPPREFDAEPDDAPPPETDTSTEPCTTQHTVRSGETLGLIAQRYNTSVQSIAKANDLTNPNLIYPGQTLCIPNPGSGYEIIQSDYQTGFFYPEFYTVPQFNWLTRVHTSDMYWQMWYDYYNMMQAMQSMNKSHQPRHFWGQ